MAVFVPWGMAYAQYLAGMAFNNASLGAICKNSWLALGKPLVSIMKQPEPVNCQMRGTVIAVVWRADIMLSLRSIVI